MLRHSAAVAVLALVTLFAGTLGAPTVNGAHATKKVRVCKIVTKTMHGKKKHVRVCHLVRVKQTPTSTPTSIPTSTATNTPTATATATATATSTATLTSTPTSIPTPVPTPTSTATATATSLPVTPTSTAASVHMVSVSASVSNPAPAQNSTVTVYGQITDNGQGVAGVPMTAVFSYKTTTSSCSGVSDSSGTAACSRDISRATRGYFVRVTVTFVDAGQEYSASTGFTPQ